MERQIIGIVHADQSIHAGLKEGTKVVALGTLDRGKNVAVRVINDVFPPEEQLHVRVPIERFSFINPRDIRNGLRPYRLRKQAKGT